MNPPADTRRVLLQIPSDLDFLGVPDALLLELGGELSGFFRH